MMKQLVLELAPRPEPDFENFVPGRNREVLGVLERLCAGVSEDRFVYLWGDPGSGRTHLLRAVVKAALDRGLTAMYLCARGDCASLATLAADAVIAVDDAEMLDAQSQGALFALYNRLRAGEGALVASGAAVPASLGIRADLATRLAWGLVYEVHALSDDEKVDAMRARALARGFELTHDVASYMLRHAPRDLPSLLALVEEADRLSLAQQRAVTVPVAREALHALSARLQAP